MKLIKNELFHDYVSLLIKNPDYAINQNYQP